MTNDVLLSHASQIGDVAMDICAGLETRGVDVWIAPRDVPEGKEWIDAILTAIDGCNGVVFLSCRESYNSQYVKTELKRANDQGMPVIPVEVDDTKPPDQIDFLTSDFIQQVEIEVPPERDDHAKIATAVDDGCPQVTVSEPPQADTDPELSTSLKILHEDEEKVVYDVSAALREHLGEVPVDIEERIRQFVGTLRENLEAMENEYVVVVSEHEGETAYFAERYQKDAMIRATNYLVEEHDLLDAVGGVPWVPGKRKAILNDSTEWDRGDCRHRPLGDEIYVDTKLNARDKKNQSPTDGESM